MSENKLPSDAKGLRLEYKVSPGTWWRYLRLIGIRKGAKVYTPIELQQIVNHLGNPKENP